MHLLTCSTNHHREQRHHIPRDNSPRNTVIFIDCTGGKVTRLDSLPLMSMNVVHRNDLDGGGVLANFGEKFVLDVQSKLPKTVTDAIKNVLEDKSIEKVMFDCRHDCDVLFHGLGITVRNVLDLQVLDMMLHEQQLYPEIGDSLQRNSCQPQHIVHHSTCELTRPLTKEMAHHVVDHINVLVELRSALVKLDKTNTKSVRSEALIKSDRRSSEFRNLRLHRVIKNVEQAMGTAIELNRQYLAEIEVVNGTRIMRYKNGYLILGATEAQLDKAESSISAKLAVGDAHKNDTHAVTEHALAAGSMTHTANFVSSAKRLRGNIDINCANCNSSLYAPDYKCNVCDIKLSTTKPAAPPTPNTSKLRADAPPFVPVINSTPIERVCSKCNIKMYNTLTCPTCGKKDYEIVYEMNRKRPAPQGEFDDDEDDEDDDDDDEEDDDDDEEHANVVYGYFIKANGEYDYEDDEECGSVQEFPNRNVGIDYDEPLQCKCGGVYDGEGFNCNRCYANVDAYYHDQAGVQSESSHSLDSISYTASGRYMKMHGI